MIDNGDMSNQLWAKVFGENKLQMTQAEWDKETRTPEQQEEFMKWAILQVKNARIFRRTRQIKQAVGRWIREYYPKVKYEKGGVDERFS